MVTTHYTERKLLKPWWQVSSKRRLTCQQVPLPCQLPHLSPVTSLQSLLHLHQEQTVSKACGEQVYLSKRGGMDGFFQGLEGLLQGISRGRSQKKCRVETSFAILIKATSNAKYYIWWLFSFFIKFLWRIFFFNLLFCLRTHVNSRKKT